MPCDELALRGNAGRGRSGSRTIRNHGRRSSNAAVTRIHMEIYAGEVERGLQGEGHGTRERFRGRVLRWDPGLKQDGHIRTPSCATLTSSGCPPCRRRLVPTSQAVDILEGSAITVHRSARIGKGVDHDSALQRGCFHHVIWVLRRRLCCHRVEDLFGVRPPLFQRKSSHRETGLQGVRWDTRQRRSAGSGIPAHRHPSLPTFLRSLATQPGIWTSDAIQHRR